MIFFGNIKDGKLSLKSKKKVEQELSTMKDGFVKLEVHYVNQRSLPQNNYIHGVLIPEFRKALVSVGYGEIKTDEQAKRIMKSMFLTREVSNEVGGNPVHYVQDTSDLSKSEMGELIEDVIRFASENCNYQIAYPNEQLKADF